MTADERKSWRRLWRTPMAVAWEAMGWTATVILARYVRLECEAARPDASAAILREVRMLEDVWGLHSASLQRLGWVIDHGEPEQEFQLPDVRSRMRVVGPAAGMTLPTAGS